MKFSLSWLRTHLDTEASLDQISTTLSAIGLEVDGIENPGAALAPFVTARIIEATQHPNADRLRVCRVDIGGTEVGVVCGAPNARTGLHAVFAPPGSYIPGTGITLKVGEIRGVTSAGMLVSARELALGEDHDGIIELPEGTAPGQPYADWAGLNDPVIEIGVTPNRGDALSVRGVARDLAATGLGTLKAWAPVPVPASFSTPINWVLEEPALAPWVLGRAIRNVKNGPSPDWLQKRLTAIGLRPINALVDITNFFTIDLGRPLHVFDADKIAGNTLTLRRGTGECLRALNGRGLVLMPDDLVIADENGAISLAGIMGGADSGTSLETTSVFIECALFNPVQVALSGRRHQINSDARARFERGIDPSLLPAALESATRMILDLCGGEASHVVAAGAEPAWQRQAHLRYERIAGLGGATIAPAEAVRIMEALGFEAASQGALGASFIVPPWRNDIAGTPTLDQAPQLDPQRAQNAAEGAAFIEPECDLLEEVLRIHGLDNIAAISLPVSQAVPAAALSPRQSRTATARRLLAARGLAECVSYSFTAQNWAQRFGDTPASLTLKNPIAADLDQMRPTPLASLVQAAQRNLARGALAAGLFEIGAGFSATGQTQIAAGLRVGTPARHWQAATGWADAISAKADLWALLSQLGVPMESLSLTTDAPAHYHPGQSATVRQGPKLILATFGTLHPSLGLGAPACGFELNLDAIPDPKRRKRAAPHLAALQPVRRDFAFVVADSVAADSVLKAARAADRTLIDQVSLFDVYRGEHVPPGQKSLAIEVVFQPTERSLTDADIEAISAKIIASVSKATGATLR